MTQFTDTKSRAWQIALDPWLVTKVKNETDVLLTKWADDKFALAVQLRTDPPLLCNVLWAICEEQAELNGCRAAAEKDSVELPREFARGLGGNTLLDALDALEGGISNFFMCLEESQAMGVVKAKEKEVRTILGKQLLENVTAIDVSQVAKSFMDSVSSSQPSPASTHSPEASRSDS